MIRQLAAMFQLVTRDAAPPPSPPSTVKDYFELELTDDRYICLVRVTDGSRAQFTVVS